MSVIKITATSVTPFSAPAGTPTAGSFMRYTLTASNGVALSHQDIPVTAEPFVAPEIDWPEASPGHYTMKIQRYDGSSIPQTIGAECDVAIVIDPPPPVVMSVPTGATFSLA